MALVADHRAPGAHVARELDQPLDILARRQGDDLERVPVSPDQVEGRSAHRSSRAEDGNRTHQPVHRPAARSRKVASDTGSSPSSLSSTPPWPGRIEPLSFTPARRFTQLS